VPTKAHCAVERRVSLPVKLDDSIAFIPDNGGNLVTVLTLVEQNINGEVRDEIPDGGNTFKRDVGQSRVDIIFEHVHICQVELRTILAGLFMRKF
jgi:hypothetical protein